IAGIVPGIMLATLLGLTTWRIARKNNYPRLPRATWGARLKAFLDAFWGLLLIVIVIGGIYGGLFTPTEAAAMSAVYAFVIAVCPWLLTMLCFLVVVTYVPEISLWLPKLLGMM